jgi:hypothetical protein
MNGARRVGVLAVAMSLLPALLAGCDGEVADEIDEEGGAIVGGTTLSSTQLQTYGLVALYHRDSSTAPWFIRPCSATILRSSGGVSKVLTARHCVTPGGNIDGTPVAASNLRLIPSVSPGLANPNPPSGAITAASVQAMPISGTSQPYHDMALVTVNVDWSSRVASKQGILVRNPSTMAGDDEPLLAFGYGVSLDDQLCFSDPPNHSPGAGTARFGGPFEPSSGSILSPGATYQYPNLSPTGQKVICGDSGGPDIGWLGSDDFTWAHVVGVHSAGTTNMTNTATNKWLQDTLGGVYLSSYWDRTKNVAANGTTGLQVLSASSGILMKYNADTQQVIAVSANKCLTTSLTLATCSTSSSQKWIVSGSQRIAAASGAGCLTHSATSSLTLQACSSAVEMSQRQMWAWHPQK